MGRHAPSSYKGLGLIGDKLQQELLRQDKMPHSPQQERRSRRSQSPRKASQPHRSKSPVKKNHGSRENNAFNIITQARVNRSCYEWDEGNYEDEETTMGHHALPTGFAKHKCLKDSSYLTISKSMMDHKNPNLG
jgi:hypothetical protein